MAVADHSNVHAPLRKYFAPKSSKSSHNQRIEPITDKERLGLDDIKEIFPQRRGYTFTHEQRAAYTLNSVRRLAILSARTM